MGSDTHLGVESVDVVEQGGGFRLAWHTHTQHLFVLWWIHRAFCTCVYQSTKMTKNCLCFLSSIHQLAVFIFSNNCT